MLFMANTLSINYLGLIFGCILAFVGFIIGVSVFTMPSAKGKKRRTASALRTQLSYKKSGRKKYKTKIKYK